MATPAGPSRQTSRKDAESRAGSQRSVSCRVRDADIADRVDNRLVLVMAAPAAVCLSTVELVRGLCVRELIDDCSPVSSTLSLLLRQHELDDSN